MSMNSADARPMPVSRRTLLRQAAALGTLALGGAATGCGGDAGGGPAPAPLDPTRLQDALRALPGLARDLMALTSVPGLAVAVVHGGQTVFAQGFGVRRAGGAEAVDADTVFQLASVSKSLAATVVARQVGAGRVAWDTPLRTLLPWFALSDADSSARVTVGDLFAHRSGLPDHAGDQLEELGFSQREVLERLRHVPVKPLRTAYAYTNQGLTAAALGVAAAAGADWAELSAAALYAPLGMARTSSRFAEFAAQSNRAEPHVRAAGGWQPQPPHDADRQSPAGGASSSVNDMARWLALVLAQGRWRQRQLIDATALGQALAPQSPDGHYGFGFNVGGRSTGGHALIDHSGAFESGAATSCVLVPGLDLGFIALSSSVPIGLVETLGRQFIDLAEVGTQSRDWWAAFSSAFQALLAPGGQLVGLPRPTAPAQPQALARYAGRYANDYVGPIAFERVPSPHGEALRLTLGPIGEQHLLQHWSGDDFFFDEVHADLGQSGGRPLVRFNPAAATVWLEYCDADGMGRFARAA